jgi:CelD/BcsL family acetyltransferase involved in cellulose biosynthesis
MLLTETQSEKEISSARDLRVERVSTDDEFALLADEWNALAGYIPFRRWEWLEAWWRHFQCPGDQLFVLCVRDSTGRLVGLAPWFARTSTMLGTVVQFLGSGKVCSDYLTILEADGFTGHVASRVADWMVQESDIPWDAIELDGVTADDPATTMFCQRLASGDDCVHRTAGLSCWRIALPATWDEYVIGLSKSRRERVRQLHRRKFETGNAVVRVAETTGDLKRGFDVLVDLHQRRRNSLGQPGCFALSAFTDFLREAAERFLRLGRLRLQWIELEGRPIAVQLDLQGGETVYHYQSGIEPQLPRERPGWLGTSAALKSAIEQKFTFFDFLRGDETYKSHWRAKPVATVNIRIAANSATARLRQKMCIRREHLKGWLKRRMKAER